MNRLASNAGLTLIETIIAMVLLIILVTSFASVFAFTSVTTYNAGNDAKTNAEARSAIDKALAEEDDYTVNDRTDSRVLEAGSVSITYNKGSSGEFTPTDKKRVEVVTITQDSEDSATDYRINKEGVRYKIYRSIKKP